MVGSAHGDHVNPVQYKEDPHLARLLPIHAFSFVRKQFRQILQHF
jgi:hypothetical protein